MKHSISLGSLGHDGLLATLSMVGVFYPVKIDIVPSFAEKKAENSTDAKN